jgi:hypothetical protein
VMHACSYPFCSVLLFAMSVIVSCSTIRTKGSMHRCAVCVHDHVRTTSSLLVVASQPGEEESTLCCVSLAWHASHTPCTHCFAVNDRTPARACESSYMGCSSAGILSFPRNDYWQACSVHFPPKRARQRSSNHLSPKSIDRDWRTTATSDKRRNLKTLR